MDKLLVVGLGGFVGAVARHGLSGFAHRVSRGAFPVGTLAVNVLGCFAIGVLMALVEARPSPGSTARDFLTIGLLGSFTTFSALGHETFEYLRAGDLRLALGNVALNVILGLGAVGLGRMLGGTG